MGIAVIISIKAGLYRNLQARYPVGTYKESFSSFYPPLPLGNRQIFFLIRNSYLYLPFFSLFRFVNIRVSDPCIFFPACFIQFGYVTRVTDLTGLSETLLFVSKFFRLIGWEYLNADGHSVLRKLVSVAERNFQII